MHLGSRGDDEKWDDALFAQFFVHFVANKRSNVRIIASFVLQHHCIREHCWNCKLCGIIATWLMLPLGFKQLQIVATLRASRRQQRCRFPCAHSARGHRKFYVKLLFFNNNDNNNFSCNLIEIMMRRAMAQGPTAARQFIRARATCNLHRTLYSNWETLQAACP